ncbi:MAG: zinc-ribbon domain-containing protein, partial [Myxococcota bacterium]|nr:zinc-ribbon domain-containing protein [Myxococcota bacterium]
MIVTCEGCSTRFQLDDERVPHGGIRVRCSCCKHAFFVKPVQTAGDPVARAVTEALHGDENAARHPAREPGGGCGAEDDDWQFNHEPRADRVGTVSDAAWQAVDESLAAGDAPPASAPVDTEGFTPVETEGLAPVVAEAAAPVVAEAAAPVVAEAAA